MNVPSTPTEKNFYYTMSVKVKIITNEINEIIRRLASSSLEYLHFGYNMHGIVVWECIVGMWFFLFFFFPFIKGYSFSRCNKLYGEKKTNDLAKKVKF